MATNQPPDPTQAPDPAANPDSPDPAPAPQPPEKPTLWQRFKSDKRMWAGAAAIVILLVGWQYCDAASTPPPPPPEPTPAPTATPIPIILEDQRPQIPDNWHCVEAGDYCFYEVLEEVESCYTQGFGLDGVQRERQEIMEYVLAATPNAAAELLAMLEAGCDEKIAGHWRLPGRTRLLSWLASHAVIVEESESDER